MKDLSPIAAQEWVQTSGDADEVDKQEEGALYPHCCVIHGREISTFDF